MCGVSCGLGCNGVCGLPTPSPFETLVLLAADCTAFPREGGSHKMSGQSYNVIPTITLSKSSNILRSQVRIYVQVRVPLRCDRITTPVPLPIDLSFPKPKTRTRPGTTLTTTTHQPGPVQNKLAPVIAPVQNKLIPKGVLEKTPRVPGIIKENQRIGVVMGMHQLHHLGVARTAHKGRAVASTITRNCRNGEAVVTERSRVTDLRFVTKNGERLEVSNTYLTEQDRRNHINALTGEPGVLHTRSEAPSKHEVRVESHRTSRKAANGRRALQRASHPPAVPSPNIQTPRPAGGIHNHEECHRKDPLAGSPFDHSSPLLDLYRR